MSRRVTARGVIARDVSARANSARNPSYGPARRVERGPTARTTSSACPPRAEVRTILIVMPSLLHRFTAWLCLALVLVTGSTPARGFVVCIENDGCVSIEIKAAYEDCDGCDGHDERDASEPVATASNDGEPCPCLDLVVPGYAEHQAAQLRSIDVHVGAWLAPPSVAWPIYAAPETTNGRGPPPCPPRVADTLVHVRTVVLLV